MNEFLAKILAKHSKTAGVRSEVDKITTVALVFQRVFGQQVLDPAWTWKKYFAHQLLILILFVYVFFGTLECLKSTHDAEVVAEACYTLIMIVIFPIKMLLFISNRHIFRQLYGTAKTTLISLIQSDSIDKFEKVLKTGRKIVNVLFLIVLVPSSIYELTTLWYYVNGKKSLLSRSTYTLMPMVSPYYEIAWFLHSIFLFEVASTIILDMWFVLLVYFLCAATESLAKIISVTLIKNETPISYSTRLNNSLRKFYNIHIDLIQYIKGLGKMYKWLAFVPLCNAAMCTCIILLLMSKEINWRFAPHLMPMFAEIFAYNWFGEQIKLKTNGLHKALINFDWRSLALKDQKNYYVIITYMKREFGIKTAVGNDLSLITMTAVFKVSYQAFTVLQTIDK